MNGNIFLLNMQNFPTYLGRLETKCRNNNIPILSESDFSSRLKRILFPFTSFPTYKWSYCKISVDVRILRLYGVFLESFAR